MADFKEFKTKIVIDASGGVQQMQGAITTMNDLEGHLSKLQTRLKTLDFGSDEYKKVQKEITRTSGAIEKARDANKTWLQTIADAPGLVGTFGQSIQGMGKAFGNFNMLLKTSLIGFIASAVIQLIEQFKKMEGVMDPVNKIAAIFSGTMQQLATVVLKPLTFTLELVAKGVEKLGNIFGSSGSNISEFTDRQDALNDSTAEYELNLSKSSAALADAREKAQDATLSTEERKRAIEEAGKLEKKIAEEGKARALEQARITAGELANAAGLSQGKIDAIKKYDAVQLESFAKSIAGNKELNQEQRTALLQQLANINEISAASSKIGKKTAAELEALRREEENKRKEAAQKALENQKKGLDAAIELEKNKNNTSEEELKKLLEKKDVLENGDILKEKARLEKRGNNLSAAEKQRLQDIKNILEVQAQARKKAIEDATKADKDAIKATAAEQDKAEKDQIDKMQATSDAIVAAKQVELEKIKILYGENSKAFKDLQNQILAIQLQSVKDQLNAMQVRQANGEKFTDEEQKQYDALGLKVGQLTNQVLANNQTEIKSAADKSQYVKDIQKQQDDWELEQSGTTLEKQMEILNARDTDIEARRQADLAKAAEKSKQEGDNEELAKARQAEINLKFDKEQKANDDAKEAYKEKSFQKQMAQLQAYADGLNALSELVGKDTVAGKALAIAAATINTYKGASEVIAAKPSLPEPANTIMKIVNVVTTIATGLKNVKEIMNVKVPTADVPEVRIRKAMGGILNGPTHAMGGIPTNMGELEGGEFVVNRASTMMFRPQLETINTMGGGQRDYAYAGFGGNTQTMEPPIIKTYVVASEMSSQQEMDRVIKNRSKF